ncbi:MAG: ComEC/Rec2 family competence protein [Mycobacteriaceae bacterium]
MTTPATRLDLRLVPAAFTAWTVTAAGLAFGLGLWLAALSAALGAAWWMLDRRVGTRHPLIRAATAGVLGAAIVGAGFGISIALRADAVHTHALARWFGATQWVTLAPVETPRRAGPARVMFRADLIRLADAETDGTVTVFAPAVDFGQLGAGQPARFRADIARPTRRDLSVAVLTAAGRPVFGEPPALQRTARAVRDRFAAAAREVLPPDQAAMLPGLVLGDTAAVPAATTADFRTAGLTHLTAVSGANVTIICAVMLLSAHLVGPRAAVALAALALAVFVVVVEPTASVLRAAIMAAIGLMAVLSGRRRQAVPVLAATVIALMVFAPQLAVDLGFALSVSATAALVVLAPVWSARLVGRGWPKVLADATCVAAAAHLVTAPLIAAISGQFSLVSVLANLSAAVVIPPITVLGTAAAAVVCLWAPLAGLLIRFTGPEVWWLLNVAHAAGRLPGAAVPVPSGWAGFATVGGVTVAAVVLWRWRWFRLACGAAALCLAAWSVSGVVGAA